MFRLSGIDPDENGLRPRRQPRRRVGFYRSSTGQRRRSRRSAVLQFARFGSSAGQFLNDEILKLMSLERKDVFVCNIVGCLPPREGDRDKPPSGDEAKKCRKFLDETLAIIKPKFICCLGTFASRKLLGTSKPLQTKQGKNVLRGKVHDHKGISVVCTYHPSSGKKKEILEDIRCLMEKMGK